MFGVVSDIPVLAGQRVHENEALVRRAVVVRG